MIWDDHLISNISFNPEVDYVINLLFNWNYDPLAGRVSQYRAEYRLILNRRGRRPSWLKSGDIPQD